MNFSSLPSFIYFPLFLSNASLRLRLLLLTTLQSTSIADVRARSFLPLSLCGGRCDELADVLRDCGYGFGRFSIRIDLGIIGEVQFEGGRKEDEKEEEGGGGERAKPQGLEGGGGRWSRIKQSEQRK